MERGQVTVEMIFIFGLFLMIVIGVSVPSVSKSELAARDVQFVSDAKFASERLATIAGAISNPYEKRNIEMYIPGFYSGDLSGSDSAALRGMCIEANGSALNSLAFILRQNSDGETVQEDEYAFSKNLGSGDWTIYINTGSGYQEGPLYEYGGRMYNLTISWGNITSNTVPSYVVNNCDEAGGEL
jgi:hypothetical protein